MLKRLVKRAAITGGLEAANLMQEIGLMPRARGRGAIFTLHHVRPAAAAGFGLNRHLEITPDFLDAAIRRLRADGYVFVSVDALAGHLARPHDGTRYAAFTLDDGFRDNAEHALPVFERHQVPFTVFVCKGFSERTHTLWWETLDALLNSTGPLDFAAGGSVVRFPLGSDRERRAAGLAIGAVITQPGEAEAVARLDALAARHGIDARALCERLVMGPAELKALAAHPLCTLGAHTVSHRALGVLPAAEVQAELEASADYVQSLTRRRPAVFAYPYGDGRSVTEETAALAGRAGFTLSLTTRPGTLADLSAANAQTLPRISLNGFFQKKRYVAALASGIPFRLMGAAG